MANGRRGPPVVDLDTLARLLWRVTADALRHEEGVGTWHDERGLPGVDDEGRVGPLAQISACVNGIRNSLVYGATGGRGEGHEESGKVRERWREAGKEEERERCARLDGGIHNLLFCLHLLGARRSADLIWWPDNVVTDGSKRTR